MLNRRSRGFTLVELLIVMTILSILISMAVPIYQRSIQRAKESVLKQNLFTLRTVIDEYTYDKQRAPQSLQDLVESGYLREIPVDPIVGTRTDWVIVMEDAVASVDQTSPGIFDVKSSSGDESLEGTPYNQW
ncbi:MAG: type II secretion system GspH family protein [Bryobacterales bacterium]|nr:type II secretion system GspH family protein [Bryobacterales bacterium]